MAKVEVTPLRSWEDFFPGSERFCKPDGKDLTRWGNRVVSNLLYYQTNYIAIALVAFIVVGCLNPEGMFAAMALGSAIFLGSVWAAENQDFMGSLKRVNPVVFGIGLTSLPICFSVILAHASYRLRNMKNKMENKIEAVGLKRSPMGLLLQALGQQEEKLMKIQNYLEEKLKD
ncbi:PRA1 family protein 3 [Dissostichus eleginoides]|uniref:PRA1 family protein n=1 Tax=Dissostichus eleginoides TaxID=100907 RepID=A0AAD9CH20_DISEL|nr:PRA1 family protein 3 [Dissostichus eleginoides]